MIFHQVINFDDPDAKKDFIRHAGLLRGRQDVTMEHWSPRRTGGMNRYYWGVVVRDYGEFVKEHSRQQFDSDALHTDLKRRFAPLVDTIDVMTGEITGHEPMSTAKMSSDQFWDYVEAIRAWLAGMNCIIPDPGEYGLRQPARKGAA